MVLTAARPIGVGVGEAVDGTAVLDQLPVTDTGLLHFRDEALDLLLRNGRIVRAMKHQNTTTDLFGEIGVGSVEVAMEADHRRDLGAAAGHLEHGATAEAKADRRDFAGVDGLPPGSPGNRGCPRGGRASRTAEAEERGRGVRLVR